MARNAIESDFRSSKMGQIGLPKWPLAAILKNLKQKLCIDLKWREMHSKGFSFIQNGRRQPFSENLKKKSKLRIDLKCREMWSKAIFGHPIWPPAAIL